MKPRSGFTLLEVLLSLGLLATVSTATFSWVHTMARSNRAAAQRLQALTSAYAIASAIRDDLIQALPDDKGRWFELQAKQLQMKTMNRLPGDPAGTKTIRWRQDERRKIFVREIIPTDPEAPPQMRAVSHRLRLIRFFISRSGIATLVCRAEGQEQDIVLPLSPKGLP